MVLNTPILNNQLLLFCGPFNEFIDIKSINPPKKRFELFIVRMKIHKSGKVVTYAPLESSMKHRGCQTLGYDL